MSARWPLVAFVVVAVTHLVALTWDLGPVAVVTKVLLVPLLVLWVLRTPERPRLLVVGLVLAWLGDVALELPGDAAFLLGLLLFLGMQVCYIRGFLALGAMDVLRRRWWIPAAYGVVWLGVNLVLGPSLGALRWPMVAYSVALTVMAVAAAGVSVPVGVGGALFLVSDLLIAVGAADHDFAGRDVVVMATYAAAQLLIVTGWVAAVRSSRPAPHAPSSGSSTGAGTPSVPPSPPPTPST